MLDDAVCQPELGEKFKPSCEVSLVPSHGHFGLATSMAQDGQLLISTWPVSDKRNRPMGSPNRNWETSSSALTGQIRPFMKGTRALHPTLPVVSLKFIVVVVAWSERNGESAWGLHEQNLGSSSPQLGMLPTTYTQCVDSSRIFLIKPEFESKIIHRSLIRSYRSPQTKNSVDVRGG